MENRQEFIPLVTRPIQAEALRLLDDNFQQVAKFLAADTYSVVRYTDGTLSHVHFGGLPPKARLFSGLDVNNGAYLLRHFESTAGVILDEIYVFNTLEELEKIYMTTKE